MNDIKFEWDRAKEASNQAKHGVSFEEARTAFFDDNARLRHDPDHSLVEQRYILLGMSVTLRLLVVCHSYRADEDVIRIISARKATRNEQQQYSGFVP